MASISLSLPPSARLFCEARERLAAGLAAGRLGAEYVAACSDAADEYFRERLAECAASAPEAPFALVAVGGYGRRELCPGSDLDALAIFAGDVPEDASHLARCLFHPLWDMGLEVGHGVRGLDECLALSAEDFQVFASFLDLRFLAGDESVFARLSRRLDDELFPAYSGRFLAWLGDCNAARGVRFGEAGAVLEPNVKEGLGGLRDYHQALWLMRLAEAGGRAAGEGDSRFAAEWEELRKNAAFLLLARSRLHLLCRRKNDKLHFEHQEKLAESLGFSGMEGALAVEVFLASLLRRMAEIKALREALWPALAEALGAAIGRAAEGAEGAETAEMAEMVDDGVERAPEGLRFAAGLPREALGERILPLFTACAELGLPLSYEARRMVRAEAGRLAEVVAASPDTVGRRSFFALTRIMMADAKGAALEGMLETGVLAAIVPEFSRVAHLVRFDVYHVHPVGRHTLEAIRRLREAAAPDMASGPFSAVYAGLEHPERLFWGALFHDVGKGLGGGHSEKGARIAEGALRRFGLDPEAVGDVAFLVRNHLFLADVSGSRDLSDRDALAHWAGKMGSTQRLDMLLLLTWADSLATGPSAWSSWKESLLLELYGKVRALIESGRLFDEHDAGRMLRARDKVRSLCGGRFRPEELEGRLENMPPRYLATVSPEDIAVHLDMLRELDEAIVEDKRMAPGGRGGRGVAVVDPRPAPGGGYVTTVAAMNARRLFVTVAGVLALYDINIVAAEVYVWDDAAAILIFRVGDPPDALYAEEVWARVRRSIKYAQTGKLSLDYRLAEKRDAFLARKAGPGGGKAPEITVDNDASELFTLVEVGADDRVGLLYDIAGALCDLDLEVHLAKASTAGDRIRDVFYVRSWDGGKVCDRERLAELRGALLHRLKR